MTGWRSRPGLAAFVAIGAILALTVVAGAAAYGAAERDFRPRGERATIADLVGRCLLLQFPAELHRHVDPELALPSVVRLTERAAEPLFADWRHGEAAAADTLHHRGDENWGQPLWRTAGDDSLDIRYAGWPLGLRIRVGNPSPAATGRVLLNGDVGHEPERVYSIRVVESECASIPFDTTSRTLR